jgi:hypothetical protein
MQSSTITVLLVLVAAHVFIASAQQQAAADCAQVSEILVKGFGEFKDVEF